jgi:7-cyano-7-deazaguanine synthase in queuosine biosynthesis
MTIKVFMMYLLLPQTPSRELTLFLEVGKRKYAQRKYAGADEKCGKCASCGQLDFGFAVPVLPVSEYDL